MSISRDSARASKSGGLSPEYALLGFLSLRQSHGYELHRQLVEDLGQIWRVSLSQTYNILARLETQGAIAGEMLTQEKLPARRQFNLTAMGRARFNEWLNQPTGCSVHAIRLEFTTRLYLDKRPSMTGFFIVGDRLYACPLMSRCCQGNRKGLP